MEVSDAMAGGGGGEAIEEEEEDDDEFEALMAAAALRALQKAENEEPEHMVDAAEKGSIALGASLVAIAYKPGGLSRDNLAAVIAEVAKGAPVFLAAAAHSCPEVPEG